MSVKQKISRFFARKTPEPVSTAPMIPTGNFDVVGVSCQVKDGLINLTDLWKASGSKRGQAPNFWSNQDDTKKFCKTIMLRENATQDCILRTQRGRNGGTFAHWQIALAYAKYLSPELHMAVNDIFRRFQEADPEMTMDMLERTKNVEDVKRIEYRARNIVTNVELNDTIHGCGGTGYIYAKVADMNNVAITGKKAKQIRKENNLPQKASTRPLLSNEQMVHMAFLEMVEKQALIKKKVKGNEAIYNTCQTAKDSIDTVLALNS